MTMGPEPMIRMRWMSVRLGIRFHQFHKLVKEIMRIMRAGRGFGMILHAKYGMVTKPETLERLIVQIHVSDFDIAVLQRVRIDGEAMVVRCDFHLVRDLVDNGVIRSPVSKLQLVCLAARG